MFAPEAILDFLSAAISGGDGDGILESNECSALTLTIKNNGTLTASSIIGVLSTSTPGRNGDTADFGIPAPSPG
jgi:hypothetical protein